MKLFYTTSRSLSLRDSRRSDADQLEEQPPGHSHSPGKTTPNSENSGLYLFFKSQKMVAQPNPVATLRWDSGWGREVRNALLHRPSCHVTRWLTALGLNAGAASPSVHSQPGKEITKIREKSN